jgi:pimeloyl-ACP methyl ester carboxylesterase
VKVVFIPGAAGASAFWTPVIERLPAGWDLRPLDLPGLGSIPARAGIASYDDLVDLAAAHLAPRGAVVAQSTGCYIALQLALRHRELVTHLVLSAATGVVDATRHGAEEWRGDYAATFPHAEAWARSHVRDLSDERLESVAVPALLLWATRDPISPLSIGQHLAGKLQNVELVAFESDDHWFVHPFADDVANAIRVFLHRTGG